MPIVTLFESPASDTGGRFGLRLGPWGAIETNVRRFRAEGGLALALRQVTFQAWGTLGMRLGAGVDLEGFAHGVGVASWGLFGEEAGDDGCWGCGTPMPPPSNRVFGVAEGIRLFAALRRHFAVDDSEWTFGIEFQPLWFRPRRPGLEYKRWHRL